MWDTAPISLFYEMIHELLMTITKHFNGKQLVVFILRYTAFDICLPSFNELTVGSCSLGRINGR